MQFHINSSRVIRPVKKNKLSFTSIEINVGKQSTMAQSGLSCRSDLSSEANFSSYRKSDA